MMEITAAYLQARLSQFPSVPRFYVAFSGGLDSHVLLHLCSQLQQQADLQFRAIHINHGLQPDAPAWEAHCEKVCSELHIPVEIHQVEIEQGTGKSLEALAREARYQVFRSLLGENEVLITAHHQDDQAETLLLQLLRGAGVAGLAAIPELAPFEDGQLFRPLLDVSREQLEAYAKEHVLNWVDDPSNLDTGFDRNFLRHEIIPRLKQRWPSVTGTLSRATTYQAEASQLLTELAEQDYQVVKGKTATYLLIPALQSLNIERQRNLVRYWIKIICQLPAPDSRHLARIFNEVLDASDDASPLVTWAGVEVRRFRDALYVMPGATSNFQDWSQSWDMISSLQLPDGSTLTTQQIPGQGLSQQQLAGAEVCVKFRQGGETCRPAGRKHTHNLKKLMQEWAIPPWQRSQVPLVFIDDQLAQVVGYCLCEPFQATDDEAGLFISQTGA